VAAKKALTCKWLQPTSPTIEDWKAIVSEIHRMEILTFSLKLKNKTKRGSVVEEMEGICRKLSNCIMDIIIVYYRK